MESNSERLRNAWTAVRDQESHRPRRLSNSTNSRCRRSPVEGWPDGVAARVAGLAGAKAV